jgi:hypothetical protein
MYTYTNIYNVQCVYTYLAEDELQLADVLVNHHDPRRPCP